MKRKIAKVPKMSADKKVTESSRKSDKEQQGQHGEGLNFFTRFN